MERVRFRSDVFSPQGKELVTQIQDSEDELEFHCSCPAGRSCEVIVEESQHGRYDVIVIRPGRSLTPEGWIVVPKRTESRYIRSFANVSSVHIRNAILRLIGMPLLGLP